MKSLCIILSCLSFFAGCYTNTPLTKDSPPLSAEVSFRLINGTYILSRTYERVESGYHVVGKLVNKEYRNSKDFDGFVSDEQIWEIVTVEFSAVKTVVGVALGIGITAAVYFAALGLVYTANCGHWW